MKITYKDFNYVSMMNHFMEENDHIDIVQIETIIVPDEHYRLWFWE